jgi:Asp/Glu/hydantoin racemase
MKGEPMRIRWQSFVDPAKHTDYFGLLDAQLQQAAGPDVTYEVIGIEPPDVHLHRLTETRCGIQATANAIRAEQEGVDAFVIGHFQDSGLHEARSAVNTPVLGLGETTMLHACTLGQLIGLITIDPIFIPWHREQIARYGLTQRVIGVTALTGLTVQDYVKACADETTFQHVNAQFAKAARPLTEAGVEVLIPAGGLPALVLSKQPGLTIDGAIVLNGVPVLAKHAEAAVELARLGLPTASRRSTFALPSPECRNEFTSALAQ